MFTSGRAVGGSAPCVPVVLGPPKDCTMTCLKSFQPCWLTRDKNWFRTLMGSDEPAEEHVTVLGVGAWVDKLSDVTGGGTITTPEMSAVATAGGSIVEALGETELESTPDITLVVELPDGDEGMDIGKGLFLLRTIFAFFLDNARVWFLRNRSHVAGDHNTQIRQGSKNGASVT